MRKLEETLEQVEALEGEKKLRKDKEQEECI